ncbi:S1 RNA-binding domain-containing protein [Halobacillus sp. Marseille-Q1614]|uniref:CvfB family protein n=1 Tax=Halobacillus sp. Marseille-Q1614 TaxID=2709134 RepID=UPI00156F6906|nr:S1-like domain-containing RNA-binding protein [Halobacillus sp. Marseille-Q1614]
MNNNLTGTIQKVKVIKKKSDGYIVTDGEHEILLPNDQAEEESFEQDQMIEVFIYENRDKQVVATTVIPEATMESYGWAEVEEVVPHLGAFVNIGLDKAFLVSVDHLPKLKRVWPKEGDSLFVSLEKDKKGRIFAEPITEGEIQEDIIAAPESLLRTEVAARVYRSTKAGSFVLTGEGYRGFIHPHERTEEPRLGEQVDGRVIDVKEDGTINISLRPLKQEVMDEDAELIYNYLVENDGVMNLTDKSDPDEIRETFQISKSAFKRAIGKLLKERKIIQADGQTKINHEE